MVVQTEKGWVAMMVSAERGRIDFKAMKPELGFQKLKRTAPEEIERVIGYRAGAVPLMGHGLPCVFDQRLLDCDYVYGGSGDACYTLKIAPEDVKRLSRVIKTLE